MSTRQNKDFTKTSNRVVLLILVIMLVGCGEPEDKYVGTYIQEVKDNDRSGSSSGKIKLQLKRDGTFRYETGFNVLTGEWRVVQSNGEEDIEFTPGQGLFLILKKTKKRGYCFEDVNHYCVLVKEK